MLSPEEALSLVSRAVQDAASAAGRRAERVPLADALGRTLAEDVATDGDAPPFDRATMDGFAVRAADTRDAGAPLSVVSRLVAGASPSVAVGPGQAIAITTGSPLPAGADAVVPLEATDAVGSRRGAETTVSVRTGVAPGQNVARRGEQARQGQVVVPAGALVRPATVGVLAAAGKATVLVAARPRVAIVATGDELVSVDRKPGASQIRDSNGHALVAQVTKAGGIAAYSGPVPDERAALRAAVEAGLAADVLLVTGGVSLGERDLIPGVLEACGVERVFHKWAVKPGGPLWFGRRGRTLVYGLPGNPAAAFVGFEVLAVPTLRVLLGRPFAPRATLRAAFEGKPPKASPRRQYVPVTLGSRGVVLVARPVSWTGSGDPFGLAKADALAVIPEVGALTPDPEGAVDVIPLDGLS